MNDLYISNREKVILELLLNQKNGITINYLASQLDVSTRTVYRELSSIESTLAQYQLKLYRENEGYFIKGNKGFIEELKSELYSASDELTTQKRQSLLMVTLLLEEEELKTESLAYDLKVSAGTVQQDLQIIEEIFKEYDIEVKKRKARGIKVTASEASLRLIVSGLIASELNEYNFFKLFDEQARISKQAFHESRNPFLDILDPEIMETIYRLVRQYGEFQFEDVNDTQLQSLILFLTFSIIRIKQNHTVKQSIHKDKLDSEVRKRSISISKEIFSELSEVYGLNSLSQEEIVFLALQIDGLNVPLRDEFSDDYDLQLSFKVRELIRLVSEDMYMQFYQDETLFQDLFAHISAAIQRNKAPMPEVNNPLLEKIHEEYTELSTVIRNRMASLFPEFEFQFNELLYVVVHFASAYERNSNAQLLNVLIICSSGMGTAKILESRLRKNVPEVTTVDVSRISQLHQLNFEQYDLILSTIFLQGFEKDYKVVTPLLMEDELKSIRKYIEQVLRDKIKKLRQADSSLKVGVKHQTFQDFFSKITKVNQLLESFAIQKTGNYDTLKSTLQQICLNLPDSVLSDPLAVSDKLEKRMVTAPIGIPSTGLGLFHCVHPSIKEPYFSIVDLPEPFEMMNMERKTMKLDRILLLLAPDPMDELTQDMMGTISASIVESDANLNLFNKGSEKQIQQHLNQLFLEKIK
ncbi:transcription antiterminator [Marinilactibacillus sp. XAAS-LB27]|uniref:BglG family transcription antiterminator n=1 Tax=Marinilactibacillus sp. XAAS-LB27 TaxID=3114538 RepID=UPI002E18625A|nr:transcription antiterminator [Marinilactibacillus sp. XAAS-LB27]